MPTCTKAEGALVAEVAEDSPAEKAGLQRGDVIIRFDDKTVTEMSSLPPMVARTPVGKEVEIVAIRKGKEKRFTVAIAELKDEALAGAPLAPKTEEAFGFAVQELTPELAEALSLQGEKGVVVSSVQRGSLADEAGLERGDLIQEIENEPVESMDDYKMIMEKAASKKQILMVVRHLGHTRYVVLKREGK
jgi:serine protease Do